MAADIASILKIEVPVIVQIGTRTMRVSEVVNLVPGSIVELPKDAEDELEILINNKAIGTGNAVKVGENFGIRIAYIGDVQARVEALAGGESQQESDEKLAEFAENLLGAKDEA